jgi:hypothetical protein
VTQERAKEGLKAMSGKEWATGIAIIAAIVGGLIYADHRARSPEAQFGPPSYVAGPNAGSEECQKLSQEWGPMIERQANEDTQADNRNSAELEQLEHSQMTDAQRQIALNNLSAKEDVAKTARENRQNNEEVSLRERLRAAGCQQLNPKLYK